MFFNVWIANVSNTFPEVGHSFPYPPHLYHSTSSKPKLFQCYPLQCKRTHSNPSTPNKPTLTYPHPTRIDQYQHNPNSPHLIPIHSNAPIPNHPNPFHSTQAQAKPSLLSTTSPCPTLLSPTHPYPTYPNISHTNPHHPIPRQPISF